MVLLTSPNNPTGTPLPMEDIERILAACETAEVVGAGEGVHPILVIDEAYVEFRKPGTPSAVSLIKDHPNLAVSRTMSKASPSPVRESATWPRPRASSTACVSYVCRTTCPP